jgi:hypothetical protein
MTIINLTLTKLFKLYRGMKYVIKRIMTYLLKARTVEPVKQPLLANGSETTFISRQRPRKELLGSRFLIMKQLDYRSKRDVYYVVHVEML